MAPYLIAIIAILPVHYFLSIATIYILMKDMGLTKAMIPWNIVILLLPILGPLSYLLFRCFKKKKNVPKSTEDMNNGHETGRK